MTLFAYGATKPKKMKLQDDRDIASHEPESTLNEDSGTESGESNTDRDSDDSLLSSDDEFEQQRGQSRGNQTITVHASTTVVMNNVSTTTISRGSGGRKSTHGQLPSDIASGCRQSPVQPSLKFPGRSFGSGRPRSFNCGWHTSFPWLEYLAERDAAFCYPCRLFYVGADRADSAFTQVGFRDWKHAMGKRGIISAHDKCSSHKQAMACWNDVNQP